MRRVLVFLTIAASATCAIAGKLDLKQDLSGLDLAVAMVPEANPDAIKITNKTAKVVNCNGTFTGADAGPTRSVTIQPGKAATIRVPGNYADMPRSAELKCAAK
jgi:hypothetical protein